MTLRSNSRTAVSVTVSVTAAVTVSVTVSATMALTVVAGFPGAAASADEPFQGGRRVAHHPLAVDLEVVVDGEPLPRQRRPGGAYYVPVRQLGCEYVLRVRNRHHRPVEAVISVDGLSVINGRPASDSIRGYLIQAGQTVDIPGWRRGAAHVAAFTFSRAEESYAHRTGRPGGIGVIQLVAFEEREARRPPTPTPLTRDADGMGGRERRKVSGAAYSAESHHAPLHHSEPRVGTAYGRELDHEVTSVPFVRSGVRHTVTLHYGRPGWGPSEEDDIFVPPPPRRFSLAD